MAAVGGRYKPRGLDDGGLKMLDIIMLAMGFCFFALSIGYAYACDRL